MAVFAGCAFAVFARCALVVFAEHFLVIFAGCAFVVFGRCAIAVFAGCTLRVFAGYVFAFFARFVLDNSQIKEWQMRPLKLPLPSDSKVLSHAHFFATEHFVLRRKSSGVCSEEGFAIFPGPEAIYGLEFHASHVPRVNTTLLQKGLRFFSLFFHCRVRIYSKISHRRIYTTFLVESRSTNIEVDQQSSRRRSDAGVVTFQSDYAGS